MGLFGRLTGWDQMNEANNAVVASHLLETASAETRSRIAEELVRIQRTVKGSYAGTLDEILDDLNEHCRSVQMNFIALGCLNLGIRPAIRGLEFHPVRNPYFADDRVTLEKIDFTIRWINKRYPAHVSWPGNSQRIDFRTWLAGTPATASINCPHCAQALRVTAGKHLRIKCPKCEHAWVQHT
jgi:hypothetical protein